MVLGLEKRHEQDSQKLLRDTRTLGQRIYDFFENPEHVATLILGCAVGVYLAPSFTDFIFLIGLGFFLIARFRKYRLPFRMPLRANILDFNDLIPGTSKARKAQGIYFFGNELKTESELWFSNADMRTHVLIFGSTGSGKTEALISMAFNALIQASGFIYVDGKGDNSLFTKIFSMCRKMGREDDLLLINFMTGARDIVGPQERRLSNTMNPFSHGSSSMLSQLVVSLMDSGSSGGSDADMWKGRAITFVEALMKILVYMRDQGLVLLDANSVRNYFGLPRLESIVLDKVFPRDNQEPVDISSAPEITTEPIKNYLINLPGYDANRKGKQVSQVLEQHGFITMQLTRVFGSLADVYGHIIRTNIPEVEMKDVVLNRRILVVLLPALEKSPDELASLGKIVVASLRAMMAAGLGEDVEGTYRDVILRKPTNANTPYLCILDEYGYYAVKGFAVVPAQARSLGFSTVFAGQDLPAFQKASKEEAASIGANTNIKICMKLEDPLETWDFFTKTAGEAYVTKVDSFQIRPDTITNTYDDGRSASSEKRARIELRDLKDQREGDAHIFFKSEIVRMRFFYASPKPTQEMRLNQFLKVAPPPLKKLVGIEQGAIKFKQLAQLDTLYTQPPTDNEEIATVINLINQAAVDDSFSKVAQSVLKELYNKQNKTQAAVFDVTKAFKEPLNIFLAYNSANKANIQLIVKDAADFCKPLLNYNKTVEFLEFTERLTGKSARNANAVSNELMKDLRFNTQYPPTDYPAEETPALIHMINDFCQKVDRVRKEKSIVN
jgi:intracellular multiplication protein IcmO